MLNQSNKIKGSKAIETYVDDLVVDSVQFYEDWLFGISTDPEELAKKANDKKSLIDNHVVERLSA